MVSYYDFILVFIPITLLGVPGFLAGVHGLDLVLAVPMGAAIAAGLIGHAMFVRTPSPAVEQRTVSADRGLTPPAD